MSAAFDFGPSSRLALSNYSAFDLTVRRATLACCIRGFASARRNAGKDRRLPERQRRDYADAFSFSWLTQSL
jgi:hypothetical protein